MYIYIYIYMYIHSLSVSMPQRMSTQQHVDVSVDVCWQLCGWAPISNASS